MAGKQHPAKDLRHWPLIQSVQGVLELASIVVFNSNPLSYQTDQIHCYCGKKDDGSEMIQCDLCDVFYHSNCVGVTGRELEGVDFECGYCLGENDDDNNQLWYGHLAPRPGKVRAPRPKPRDPAELARRLARYAKGEREWVGPRNWPDLVKKVADHAIKLRGKEQEKYAKARAKRDGGGHHMFDTVAGNTVAGAPIGPELIDYLEGNGWLD